MKLAHIGVKRLEASDTNERIEGVIVWQPYGWFVHMVLREVTDSDLSAFENLISFSSDVQFMNGSRQAYDRQQKMAWVEIYDREYIDEFVRRGALRNPQVMYELGCDLLARLESRLQKHRSSRR